MLEMVQRSKFAGDLADMGVVDLIQTIEIGRKSGRINFRRKDGATDTALLQFLTQQKWATAYEKQQQGQNTVVIQNTQGDTPAIALPAFTADKRSEGGNNGQTAD